jgi:hypothetical protein
MSLTTVASRYLLGEGDLSRLGLGGTPIGPLGSILGRPGRSF